MILETYSLQTAGMWVECLTCAIYVTINPSTKKIFQ